MTALWFITGMVIGAIFLAFCQYVYRNTASDEEAKEYWRQVNRRIK